MCSCECRCEDEQRYRWECGCAEVKMWRCRWDVVLQMFFTKNPSQTLSGKICYSSSGHTQAGWTRKDSLHSSKRKTHLEKAAWVTWFDGTGRTVLVTSSLYAFNTVSRAGGILHSIGGQTLQRLWCVASKFSDQPLWWPAWALVWTPPEVERGPPQG